MVWWGLRVSKVLVCRWTLIISSLSTISEMPIVLPSPSNKSHHITKRIILCRSTPITHHILVTSRRGSNKSYMSTIPKLICMSTPKIHGYTSFQAWVKHDNPSAQPILPRSKVVHLYPKETCRMPLQDLGAFLWINSSNPLTTPITTWSSSSTNTISMVFHKIF